MRYGRIATLLVALIVGCGSKVGGRKNSVSGLVTAVPATYCTSIRPHTCENCVAQKGCSYCKETKTCIPSAADCKKGKEVTHGESCRSAWIDWLLFSIVAFATLSCLLLICGLSWAFFYPESSRRRVHDVTATPANTGPNTA